MQEQTTTVTDPVCGMTVDPATATSIEHEGHAYYFCCKGCAKTFAKDPGASSSTGCGESREASDAIARPVRS